jgi:hypothetical protein
MRVRLEGTAQEITLEGPLLGRGGETKLGTEKTILHPHPAAI